jgi:hypothetical protein
MIERYCGRSFWYNAMLRKEVARLGLKSLEISDGMRPVEIVDACLNLLSRDTEKGAGLGLDLSYPGSAK